MLVYYFVPSIVSNRYLLFWVSNGHNSVTVQNRTHVYMNFFDQKDLGNHLLHLCPKVVKHPVYIYTWWKTSTVEKLPILTCEQSAREVHTHTHTHTKKVQNVCVISKRHIFASIKRVNLTSCRPANQIKWYFVSRYQLLWTRLPLRNYRTIYISKVDWNSLFYSLPIQNRKRRPLLAFYMVQPKFSHLKEIKMTEYVKKPTRRTNSCN